MNFLLYHMFIINIFKSNIYKLLNRLIIERKRMKNSGSTKSFLGHKNLEIG